MRNSFGKAFVIGGILGVVAQQVMKPHPLYKLAKMGRRTLRKSAKVMPIIRNMM